ncbi:type III secretion system chaperone [Succinivibrio dextrinosolvens]|uniref:type III secretion system chaperone n=1 Tax=Succinivibrio dextrinosolvens TaxID=83771 RepID=UPI0004E25392|nr:type III secretion system chaperone [Succinivibrio dextrinosolvens]
MNINELIRNLGIRLGLKDLQLSKSGVCSIEFGQDEVIFEQEGDKLFIIAEIGQIDGNENVFRAMLDANNCARGSGFGSLGVDPERNCFTLSRLIEGDYNNELFEKQIQLFVSTLRFWKQYLIDNGERNTADSNNVLDIPLGSFLA